MGWNKVTESISVSDAYPGSDYTIQVFYKMTKQAEPTWTDPIVINPADYSTYPYNETTYIRFTEWSNLDGESTELSWVEDTTQKSSGTAGGSVSGSTVTPGTISKSYTCSRNITLKVGHSTAEENRYLYDANWVLLRAGKDLGSTNTAFYERVVIKITYYPTKTTTTTVTNINYHC